MNINFTFSSISLGVVKLFMLMAAGYFTYNRKLVDEIFLDKLSLLLVRVIFPALIISKIVTHFSFSEYRMWWALPLSAVIFCLAGMGVGAIVFRVLGLKGPVREFMCASGFQNCGYLPMTLILFSFTQTVADKLLIYVFLFVVGFNLLMWSVIPLFLSRELRKSFRPGHLFTPPVVATVFALLWVAVFGKESMPAVIIEPLGLLGQAAFPLAMMVLGAYLCRYQAHIPENKMPIISGVILKLLLFPVIVIGVLFFLPLGRDLKFFLFLESIMPSAVSLVIVGAYTGADNRFFSSMIFYSHLAAIFIIPLWLEVFHLVFKT